LLFEQASNPYPVWLTEKLKSEKSVENVERSLGAVFSWATNGSCLGFDLNRKLCAAIIMFFASQWTLALRILILGLMLVLTH